MIVTIVPGVPEVGHTEEIVGAEEFVVVVGTQVYPTGHTNVGAPVEVTVKATLFALVLVEPFPIFCADMV